MLIKMYWNILESITTLRHHSNDSAKQWFDWFGGGGPVLFLNGRDIFMAEWPRIIQMNLILYSMLGKLNLNRLETHPEILNLLLEEL